MTKRKKKRGEGLAGVVSLLIPAGDHPKGEPVEELNPALDLVSQSFKHVDEFIDDESQPECLRKFLDRARSPAHGHLSKEPYPKLFATYQGEGWRGVEKGDRVRVVMASRLGDVGVTKNLEAESGYQLRTSVDNLSEFSDRPERF
jgi:hypothetical protein